MMEIHSFLPGDLVLVAKSDGHYWPAKIVKKLRNHCTVIFYLTDENGKISMESVVPYDKASRKALFTDTQLSEDSNLALSLDKIEADFVAKNRTADQLNLSGEPNLVTSVVKSPRLLEINNQDNTLENLWNMFLEKSIGKTSGICFLPRLLIEFANEHKDALMDENTYKDLILHVLSLEEIGLISSKEVKTIVEEWAISSFDEVEKNLDSQNVATNKDIESQTDVLDSSNSPITFLDTNHSADVDFLAHGDADNWKINENTSEDTSLREEVEILIEITPFDMSDTITPDTNFMEIERLLNEGQIPTSQSEDVDSELINSLFKETISSDEQFLTTESEKPASNLDNSNENKEQFVITESEKPASNLDDNSNENKEKSYLGQNKRYQDHLQTVLESLQDALHQNLARQGEIDNELMNSKLSVIEPSSSRQHVSVSKASLTVFCAPYFKDKQLYSHPKNMDVIKKEENKELDVYTINTTNPVWTKSNRKTLKSIVRENALMKNVEYNEWTQAKEILIQEANKNGITDEEKEGLMMQIAWAAEELKKIDELSKDDDLFENRDDDFDWDKISVEEFPRVHSAKSCELQWKNLIHPSWNQTAWSRDEDKLLEALADITDETDWEFVAKHLGTERPPISCMQRFMRKQDKEDSKRSWDTDEDQLLLQLVEEHRINNLIPFRKIACHMEGRDKEQCRQRYLCSLKDLSTEESNMNETTDRSVEESDTNECGMASLSQEYADQMTLASECLFKTGDFPFIKITSMDSNQEIVADEMISNQNIMDNTEVSGFLAKQRKKKVKGCWSHFGEFASCGDAGPETEESPEKLVNLTLIPPNRATVSGYRELLLNHRSFEKLTLAEFLKKEPEKELAKLKSNGAALSPEEADNLLSRRFLKLFLLPAKMALTKPASSMSEPDDHVTEAITVDKAEEFGLNLSNDEVVSPVQVFDEISMTPQSSISMTPQSSISIAPQSSFSMTPQSSISMTPQSSFSMASQSSNSMAPHSNRENHSLATAAEALPMKRRKYLSYT